MQLLDLTHRTLVVALQRVLQRRHERLPVPGHGRYAAAVDVDVLEDEDLRHPAREGRRPAREVPLLINWKAPPRCLMMVDLSEARAWTSFACTLTFGLSLMHTRAIRTKAQSCNSPNAGFARAADIERQEECVRHIPDRTRGGDLGRPPPDAGPARAARRALLRVTRWLKAKWI